MGKVAKWEMFSKEEFAKIVEESTSFAQVAEKVGYKNKSDSGAEAVKRAIEKRGLDISHFLGQGWNKNNFKQENFQKNKYVKNETLKGALIYERGHCCESCKNTLWLNKEIPLEIYHKDGNSLNNEKENLELLCPNCHALTENYRNRNNAEKEKRKVISEEEFKKALEESENIRQALLKLNLAPKGGNYTTANKIIAKYNIKFKK